MCKYLKWLLLAIAGLFCLSAVQLELNTDYPLHPGFPKNVGLWVEKAPVTIADIDNNGSNELLLPTFNGKIYAWNASGSLLPGFPINAGERIQRGIALGDLNQDGKLEIVAGVESINPGVDVRIFVWRPNGTLFPGWPQDTSCTRIDLYCSATSIVIAELDGMPDLEIIVATSDGTAGAPDPNRSFPALYAWHSNGQLLEGKWPIADDLDVKIGGAMAVGDLNSDGKADIVTGRDYNRLFAYDNQGNDLTGWPHYVWWPYDSGDWQDDQIEFARSGVTLADLDGDGILEYIVNGLRRYAQSAEYYNTDLLIYKPNGNRWRNWETPASGAGLLSQMTWRMLEAPAIGDINGDHRPDIVVSTQDGWVRAYTAEKQLLWSFNYAQGKLVYASETVIGDVDGDGWNEVIFGTFDANYGNVGPVGVWILDHNGQAKAGMPLVVNAPGVTAAPSLSDLDGDGKIEISAVTFSGVVYVWDAPGELNPNRMPWPMARHDLQRTALFVNPESDLTQSYKKASNTVPRTGDTVTYTIQLVRKGASVSDPVHVTDIVPAGLSYIAGSLSATAGSTDDSLAPTLSWTGALPDLTQVTITYAVAVAESSTVAITNSALIEAGSAGQLTRKATIVVNGQEFYLPYIHH